MGIKNAVARDLRTPKHKVRVVPPRAFLIYPPRAFLIYEVSTISRSLLFDQLLGVFARASGYPPSP
jgi:hypothetical protein